jgi:hypothetical protein
VSKDPRVFLKYRNGPQTQDNASGRTFQAFLSTFHSGVLIASLTHQVLPEDHASASLCSRSRRTRRLMIRKHNSNRSLFSELFGSAYRQSVEPGS